MGIELVKKSGSLTVAAPPVESLEEIYKQGQASMVDETKIIEATAQGKGSVALDDVSEIPHDITVEYSKTIYGKNLNSIGTIQFTQVAQKLPLCGWSETIPAGTYTFSAVLTSTETSGNRCAVGFYDEAGQQVNMVWLLPNINKRAYTAVALNKPARYLYLYADNNWNAAAGDTAVYKDIQLEIGSVATEYEPYKEPYIITNKEVVKSISPNMSFTADSDVDIKVSYRKSWGMDEEWSRFWDSYQDYGKRTNYAQSFYNIGWNSTTFKPKYDLIVTGNAYCIFGYSHITEIPFIDLTGTTSLAQIFYYCTKLKTIKLIKVTKNNLFVNTSFAQCSALENITFDGEIAGDLDFHYSPNLTKESMLNILNHLYDYSTTGETHNLYFGQGLMSKLTDTEKALATQKGWTIF